MLDHWSVHNWCQYCQRRGRSFGKIPRNIKEMKHSSAVHFLKLLKICISMSASCFSKVIQKGKDHDPSEVRLLNLYEKESFSTPLTYHLTPVSSNAQLNPEPVMMKSGWSHLDLQDSHPHKKRMVLGENRVWMQISRYGCTVETDSQNMVFIA